MIRRVSYRGEQIATVVYPDGALRKIPTWMIETQAAQMDLRDPPRISKQSLNELRRFIDVVQSALDAGATLSEPDGGAA